MIYWFILLVNIRYLKEKFIILEDIELESINFNLAYILHIRTIDNNNYYLLVYYNYIDGYLTILTLGDGKDLLTKRRIFKVFNIPRLIYILAKN